MPDDIPSDDSAINKNTDTGGPGGFMVPVAVILIAILIVLVVFMNLSGQGATAATAITENSWALRSFGNPDGTATPVLNGTTITAKFTVDSKFTGSGSCSRYSARYIVRSTEMVVSRVTTTSMACTDADTVLQEKRYYASVEDAAALRIHDNILTLYGMDGKPLLIFIPVQQG